MGRISNSLLILSFILLSVACSSKKEVASNGPFQASVSDVRITFELPAVQNQSGLSPVVGAVIGGIVGGTTGAIVGTAIASESKPTSESNSTLIACSFKATLYGNIAIFRISGTGNSGYAQEMRKCSTLRDSDFVTLYRNGSGLYEWNFIASDTVVISQSR